LTVNNCLLGTGQFAPGPPTDNAIVRKRNISGVALESDAATGVVSIEPLGVEMPMYDITTGTGDFIANGVVSHNCYARPSHEYLGLNAGLDFETVIFVKENAPELFRAFLNRPAWRPEAIIFSGVTDCYQPAERHYRLTRGCLEVAVEARQPISIITKNALILRDLDLLGELARDDLVHVSISLTTLDADLARSMEPRTSVPAARLRALEQLSEAGVPVRAMLAPVIPGLNDHEIPALLEAASGAGAWSAAYILLRLPGTVEQVFREWLEREQPERLEKIEGRLRAARGGKLNDPAFGRRMKGSGEMADRIRDLFRLFARKYGLDGPLPAHDTSRFRPPRAGSGQLWLF
jgi:DNA repair photolyase